MVRLFWTENVTNSTPDVVRSGDKNFISSIHHLDQDIQKETSYKTSTPEWAKGFYVWLSPNSIKVAVENTGDQGNIGVSLYRDVKITGKWIRDYKKEKTISINSNQRKTVNFTEIKQAETMNYIYKAEAYPEGRKVGEPSIGP